MQLKEKTVSHKFNKRSKVLQTAMNLLSSQAKDGIDRHKDESSKDGIDLAEENHDLEKLLRQTEEMNAVISAG